MTPAEKKAAEAKAAEAKKLAEKKAAEAKAKSSKKTAKKAFPIVVKYNYKDEERKMEIKEGEENHVHVMTDTRTYDPFSGKVTGGQIGKLIIDKNQFPSWAANHKSVGHHKCVIGYAPEGMSRDIASYQKKIKTTTK